MRTTVLILIMLAVAMTSCKKDDLALKGEPSLVGAVGNELTFAHSIPGIGAVTAEVTSVTDGVSEVEATFTITNEDMLAMAQFVENLFPADVNLSGNTLSSKMLARFTTDGIAWVTREGDELVVCKYNASVGDEYSLNVSGRNVRHKVTQKSTEDDYSWGFYNIKVVTMEATNYGLPGLNKVEYISNHRFGPVGIKGYFSDGGTMEASIFSLFDNE